MSTLALRPADRIDLLERRGEVCVTHHAPAGQLSMDEKLAGAHGEPSLRAVFLLTDSDGLVQVRDVENVVHCSHVDWTEGRVGLAYCEVTHEYQRRQAA